MNESDIVKDFLVESYENLDRLDRDLVGLERNPNDKDALAGVFRTIHTIKGTCGFLGFGKLEKVAHVGENLLTRLRDGQLTLNPEITTALLGMVDAVRQMLKEVESTGQDGENDYPELRETLTRLQNAEAPAVAAAPPAVPVATPARVEAASRVEPEIASATPASAKENPSPSPSQPFLRQPSRNRTKKRARQNENLPAGRSAASWSSAEWCRQMTWLWLCKNRKEATGGEWAKFWCRWDWLGRKM